MSRVLSTQSDFLIVGGGILGLATAYQLMRRQPAARITLLEKEPQIALHQSGRNSGVIHAGVYYEPGSLKARLCRAGLKQTIEFCQAHSVPYLQCGKLIVATSSDETERLRILALRAAANGASSHWLAAGELAEREPAIRGEAALLIPESGMVDYGAVCHALRLYLLKAGVELRLNTEVLTLRESASEVVATTNAEARTARYAIVCAGVLGDRLARRAGLKVEFALIPFRGDYYRLPAARSGLVNHHIYPVPDPRLPFLGVHLTRLIDGGISVGPSAMLAFAREGYDRLSFDVRDSYEMLKFPGLWRLLARFPAAGVQELAAASSSRFYLRLVHKYCPEIELSDLLPHPSGVRAQAVSRDGKLVHDFILRQTARITYVLNAPSPAATSALPIAAEIIAQAPGALL